MGGIFNEESYSMLPLENENYVIAGYASSNDGDVTGIHLGAYYDDYWVVNFSYTPLTIIHKEGSSIGVDIFPNPTDNEVVINFEKELNNTIHLLIVNLLGQVVKDINLSPSKTLRVDISEFISGLYLFDLRTSDNQNRIVFKVYKN